MQYEDVMYSDDGVRDWTELIVRLNLSYNMRYLYDNNQRKYGFCYVNGCPVTPAATKELLERISFIRNTHYGMRFRSMAHLRD